MSYKKKPFHNQKLIQKLKKVLITLLTILAVISLVNVNAETPTWKNIVAGANHTLGIKPDSTLWAWGSNSYGELGINSTTNKKTAVRVDTSNNWIAVAAGGVHTLGLKTDGTLWAWGANNFGQLGTGNTLNRPIPTQIGTDTNWKAVAAGYGHSIALKTDGTLWAWGHNYSGQLGIGDTIKRISPIQIGTGWKSIAAGTYFSLGLKADNTLWAWGDNSFGQLADSTTQNRKSPIQIGRDSNWTNAVAGYGHVLGIKADSTLWSWGYNAAGQLGDLSNISKKGPVKIKTYVTSITGDFFTVTISSDIKCTKIVAGEFHSLAITADSALMVWGANGDGQLGDGTFTNRNYPIKIPAQLKTDSNWVDVTTGAYHSIALKSNGGYCRTGSNQSGQLGDGTNINQYSFVCIDDALTGVEELIETSNQLSIYPNPNNGLFTIQSTKEGIYFIVNELGQRLQQIKLNSTNNYTANIETLNTGIYFIVGFNHNLMTSRKVIVTK